MHEYDPRNERDSRGNLIYPPVSRLAERLFFIHTALFEYPGKHAFDEISEADRARWNAIAVAAWEILKRGITVLRRRVDHRIHSTRNAGPLAADLHQRQWRCAMTAESHALAIKRFKEVWDFCSTNIQIAVAVLDPPNSRDELVKLAEDAGKLLLCEICRPHARRHAALRAARRLDLGRRAPHVMR
jgi:hypothetical protein